MEQRKSEASTIQISGGSFQFHDPNLKKTRAKDDARANFPSRKKSMIIVRANLRACETVFYLFNIQIFG